ncbi:SlyX family protein [Dasania sp. GY-MA-18]|uniref:SlyX family protein n=1 Tax=Dasania phycosphaerae TaxID=2950436 RepID=A0A9J6RN13_9GAMM|nr:MULTISPECIES: SlyX family protein [Dasania]MCR8923265.1 SlyX family protein [Dasania sp. GY-MA-18]MCZ0865697.1 SlyX family protein [Dasania phycosphaerae]MCZ0869422.1 SlyX family protein [Dasania phycosphaerae]
MAEPDSDMREQLVDLQSQLAFQEDTIYTLNQIVTEQQQQLERLNEMINQLKLQIEAAPDGQNNQALSERPPHY